MKKQILIGATFLAALSSYAQRQTSPDGKRVVFVKQVSGPAIEWGGGKEQPTELWQIDAHGKHPTLLVRCRNSDKMAEVIAGFANLQFSSDGKLVYFNTPAWATSPAVHVVDTTTRREHFLIDGWIQRIAYTDQGDRLIVSRRQYDSEGVYHDDFVVTPEGEIVGHLGIKER